MKTVAEVLHDTRVYLEEHGWTQGRIVSETTGRVCLVGALIYSQGYDQHTEDEDISDDDQALLTTTQLRLCDVGEFSSIPCWNDRPGRKKQEVLDLLAKAEKIELAGFDPDAP